MVSGQQRAHSYETRSLTSASHLAKIDPARCDRPTTQRNCFTARPLTAERAPMYFPWAHRVSYRCVWVSISCRSKFCFFRWHNPAARQTRLLGFQPKGLDLVYKHVPVWNNKFPPCSASQGVAESQEPLALLKSLPEGTEKGALNLYRGNRTRGQKCLGFPHPSSALLSFRTVHWAES